MKVPGFYRRTSTSKLLFAFDVSLDIVLVSMGLWLICDAADLGAIAVFAAMFVGNTACVLYLMNRF